MANKNMTTPWLSQEEIDDLCTPLTQYAAQIRFIRRLDIQVHKKPNGAPLVIRSHFDAAMGSLKKKKATKPEPNRAGLQLVWGGG